jgi:uncharacterized protein YdhG (YjbR/CyaY superfamily)
MSRNAARWKCPDGRFSIIIKAEQCISYRVPTFRLEGKIIAEFATFKNHRSYLPHSGSVISELGEAVSQYKRLT